MSKARLNLPDTDKIDTYLDTSNIFPFRLCNKKLLIEDDLEYNRDYYSALSQYLKTRNPDLLVSALKLNDSALWYGRKLYDDFSSKLILKDDYQWKSVKKIPDYIVVWESLISWINDYQWLQDRNELLEVTKKYIIKIAPTLILQRLEYDVNMALDGIEHYKSHIQGKSVSIGYSSPDDFIKMYNEIKEVFKNCRTTRKRTLEVIIKEVKNAIKKINDNVSEDDLKYFKLKKLHEKEKLNIHSIVLNFIRVRHGNICKRCDDISYTKVEQLYKEAKKGIYNNPLYR